MAVIWLKFCFHTKEERFYLRRTFQGIDWLMCWTTRALLYKHSRPSPNNLRVLKWLSEKAAKGTRCIGRTTESSGFSASGDALQCRFCPHDVDWKCLRTDWDHLWIWSAREKQGEMACWWWKILKTEFWSTETEENGIFGKKNEMDFIGP